MMRSAHSHASSAPFDAASPKARDGQTSAATIESIGGGGLLDRVGSHLSRAEARDGRRMNTGTGILATIGSSAPFIGLFGKVWGIMNNFIGIAESNTTNLAL